MDLFFAGLLFWLVLAVTVGCLAGTAIDRMRTMDGDHDDE